MFRAIAVIYIENKYNYFASRFYTTTSSLGTLDEALQRLTVSRCEVDLGNIKDAYAQLYGESLHNDVSVRKIIFIWSVFSTNLFWFVQSDTSGDYRSTLLALIRWAWMATWKKRFLSVIPGLLCTIVPRSQFCATVPKI